MAHSDDFLEVKWYEVNFGRNLLTHNKLIFAEFSLIWNKLQSRANMYNFNDESVTINGATLSN